MVNLFEKVDLFYTLATAGDRKSLFNSLANSSLVMTPEVFNSVSELVKHLDPELPESSALINVSSSDKLQDVKMHIQALAAATANIDGRVYTDAVTVLTQVNREMRAQTEKRK